MTASIGDPCVARYESDQVRCAACRLVWDRNDPDPPECGRKALPVVDAPNMDIADAFAYAFHRVQRQAPPLVPAPGLAGYVSQRVFAGKRPLSPETAARLKERHREPFVSALAPRRD